MLATGKTAFNFASGLIVRPSLSLYFLMYTQIFLVTSVRGIFFPPQISANAGLRVFGAKRPTPFFFMAVLPSAFFVAFKAFVVALVTVGFFVVVVATFVFFAAVFVVVVIISIERVLVHTSFEP